jgi:heme-degrading monooxygenase HmoA
MIARVTLAEIDPVRMSVERATRLFEESVVPALREQDGYEGAYVLLSDQGKVLALTFWETEEAAEAGLRGSRSFYAEQVEKFVTLYRLPPGREMYDVVVADVPAATHGWGADR